MKQASHLALASIALAAPALAMAAGKITFKGKVIEQTCSVTVEGTESPTVDLPTVSKKQLVDDKTAGLTPFTVKVSGCEAGKTELKINTVFSGGLINPETGNLSNIVAADAAAENVEVQLLSDASGAEDSVIELTSVTSVPGLALPSDGTTTSASREFAARYYAAGPVTAGDVQAVVNYDITYQ